MEDNDKLDFSGIHNSEYYLNEIYRIEKGLGSLCKGTSKYLMETRKLTEYICGYYVMLDEEKGKDYAEYDLELLKTIEACLKYFDPEKGSFWAYFQKSWKNEYKKQKGFDLITERTHGMGMSKNDKKLKEKIGKYISKLQRDEPKMSDDEIYEQLVKELGKKEETLVALNSIVFVNPEYENEDGETVSVFNFVSASTDIESNSEEAEKYIRVLQAAEKAFSQLKEAAKPIISELFTSDYASIIKSYNIDFSKYQIVNGDVYAETLRLCKTLKHKDIAIKYGKTEAGISMEYKRFTDKIRKYFFGEK